MTKFSGLEILRRPIEGLLIRMNLGKFEINDLG